MLFLKAFTQIIEKLKVFPDSDELDKVTKGHIFEL